MVRLHSTSDATLVSSQDISENLTQNDFFNNIMFYVSIKNKKLIHVVVLQFIVYKTQVSINTNYYNIRIESYKNT